MSKRDRGPKLSGKQQRRAEHLTDRYEDRGVGQDDARHRAEGRARDEAAGTGKAGSARSRLGNDAQGGSRR